MGERRLILWDIDMTLVNTGAAGQHALIRTTIEWFGGEGDLTGVEIAGRTGVPNQVGPGELHGQWRQGGADLEGVPAHAGAPAGSWEW